MKAHKAGDSDEQADFVVEVNGIECSEYTLPSNMSTEETNVVECFIPVSEGDRLTIKGNFRGTILHGAFDLIADGTFVRRVGVEGKKGISKFVSQKVNFDKALDTPIPTDWTSTFAPNNVVEGDLRVKTLSHRPVAPAGHDLGVGSVAVIVSVNQTSTDTHTSEYKCLTVGSFPKGPKKDVTDGGIVQTHELEVDVTDNNVHMNRMSRHRRHAVQTRFGTKQWAAFVFHYRSQKAIREAGCVVREDRSQAIEAGDEDSLRTVARKPAAVPKLDETKPVVKSKTSDNIKVTPMKRIFEYHSRNQVKTLGLEPQVSSSKKPRVLENGVSPGTYHNLDSTSVGSGDENVQSASMKQVYDSKSSPAANDIGTLAIASQITFPRREIVIKDESRSPTPSTAGHRSKKAALMAQIEEKKARNKLAKQKLVNQQHLRDEQEKMIEERELRQIEELERQDREADEEFESLERGAKIIADEVETMRMNDGSE